MKIKHKPSFWVLNLKLYFILSLLNFHLYRIIKIHQKIYEFIQNNLNAKIFMHSFLEVADTTISKSVADRWKKNVFKAIRLDLFM